MLEQLLRRNHETFAPAASYDLQREYGVASECKEILVRGQTLDVENVLPYSLQAQFERG